MVKLSDITLVFKLKKFDIKKVLSYIQVLGKLGNLKTNQAQHNIAEVSTEMRLKKRQVNPLMYKARMMGLCETDTPPGSDNTIM